MSHHSPPALLCRSKKQERCTGAASHVMSSWALCSMTSFSTRSNHTLPNSTALSNVGESISPGDSSPHTNHTDHPLRNQKDRQMVERLETARSRHRTSSSIHPFLLLAVPGVNQERVHCIGCTTCPPALALSPPPSVVGRRLLRPLYDTRQTDSLTPCLRHRQTRCRPFHTAELDHAAAAAVSTTTTTTTAAASGAAGWLARLLLLRDGGGHDSVVVRSAPTDEDTVAAAAAFASLREKHLFLTASNSESSRGSSIAGVVE
jgi:hypothetical protein